ncbi:MAG: translation initiation factor IF-2 [Gammaproteobacteria bacterium]
MADVTVTQFADVLKVTVDKLLEQMAEAGIEVGGASDTITEDDKLQLLTHLRTSHGRKDEGAAPKKITLKRKQQSELKLSGGQGRSRTVNVEVRKKRTYVNRGVLEEEAKAKQDVLDAQRDEELAEVNAKKEETEQRHREIEEKRKAEEERVERERAEKAEKAELEARNKAEADERKRVEEERRKKQDAERKAKKTTADKAKATKYGRKELHVAQNKSGRRRTKKPVRRRPVAVNADSQSFEKPTAPVVREVAIGETITVAELAQKMAVKANEVIKTMMGMGAMVTINQAIDQDTAQLVVEEMGHTVSLVSDNVLEDEVIEAGQAIGDEVTRAPVVTVMGHVDHGKTSLLDYIRRAKVADGEAGGITQHIGAYRVSTSKGDIAFLDTPGHEAFTAMRSRGAQLTDIVILVVAGDDGVMPQTIEAIKHSKAAGVPIIVAVNKMDREQSDIERVKNEMSQHEVLPEDWGGDVPFVPVSAKTGDGIDDLLENISLQAELLELTATAEGPAAGVVIESSLEKGRGAVATVLVSRGMLKIGDTLLAGTEFGRVRAMFDELGKPIKQAGPSTPAVVLGLSGTPNAGDDILTLADDRKARDVAQQRQDKMRDQKLAKQQASRLEDVFSQMSQGERESVNLVIKADVQGSAEALSDALLRLVQEDVNVKIVLSAVGGITESDVNLAVASNAIIIGFNTRADSAARSVIKESGIDLHYYSIIYEAIDEVKRAISGKMAPEIKEQIVGLAEVKEVFTSPKLGQIAGCLVSEGFVRHTFPIRVLRDNVVIYEGELESLRRFKDMVKEVRSGTECGIGVKNYNDVRPGDQIECFERIEVARSI